MNSLKGAVATMVAACCLLTMDSCRDKNGPQPVTGLGGTVLEQPTKAVDFTLTDQHGSTFRMADTKGKVVMMSFIQTDGGDAKAAEVRTVADLLGANASGVVFVAVTLDPERDTLAEMAAYSRQLGLFDIWNFVGGSPAEVKAVLFDYGVAVSSDPETPFGSYDREYFAPLRLIDKQGYIRTFINSDVTPAEVAKSIRLLLTLK